MKRELAQTGNRASTRPIQWRDNKSELSAQRCVRAVETRSHFSFCNGFRQGFDKDINCAKLIKESSREKSLVFFRFELLPLSVVGFVKDSNCAKLTRESKHEKRHYLGLSSHWWMRI